MVIWQILPDDFSSFFFAYLLFDGVDLIEPFLVVLDGLQVAGDLDAFGERLLGSLEHLVADAILETGQEELVLNEASVTPSALISASVAPAAMLTRTAAIAAGFLSVKHL